DPRRWRPEPRSAARRRLRPRLPRHEHHAGARRRARARRCFHLVASGPSSFPSAPRIATTSTWSRGSRLRPRSGGARAGVELLAEDVEGLWEAEEPRLARVSSPRRRSGVGLAPGWDLKLRPASSTT